MHSESSFLTHVPGAKPQVRTCRSRGRSLIDRLENRVLLSASSGSPWTVIAPQLVGPTALPPTVSSFTLINADTNLPIPGMSSLANGAVLNFASLGTTHLNVRANIAGGVGSVKFGYDAKSSYRIENGAPYALGGNRGLDYFSWTPTLGAHTLSATPYALRNAAGAVGAKRAIAFTVIANTTLPTVTVLASDASASEAGSNDGAVVVQRTGATNQPLTVNLGISGTAINGTDYAAIGTTVTIPAGAAAATVTVHPINDTTAEPTETVVIQAAAGSAYALNAAAFSATVSIADDDSPVSPPSPPPPPPPPSPPPPPITGDHHYLYVYDAPKDKTGFFTLARQIEVFDIDNGHQWVKNIPIPAPIYDIRGVAAVASTHRMYVSYFLSPKIGYQPGGLLCMDLNTNQLIWRQDYSQTVVPAPDRFDITHDGKKIYMPSGEFGTSDFWTVIDGDTGTPLGRIHHTTTAHNTVISADGRLAFLEGQEKQTEDPSLKHTIGVVDTATDQVIQKVGPFKDVVRPFTVNGNGTLVFATMNNFIGFQVGSVTTGKILFTAAPPGVPQPATVSLNSHAHGIALTSDEKRVYVVDTDHNEVHSWDVSGVANGIAPVYLGAIKVRKPGKNLAGATDPAASNDTTGVPSWLGESIDGHYLYAEGGEIIDTTTNSIVGQLRAKTTNSSGNLVLAPYTHSRFYLEIDFQNGQVVSTGDQFGIGRVTG